MMKKAVLAVASVLALAVAAPANAAVFYQSFESPALGTGSGAYAYGTTNPFSGNPNVPSTTFSIPGVTFSGASGVQTNGSAFGFTNAPDGTKTAFIQSYQGTGGAISIALTGLTAGQRYFVNFSAALRGYITPSNNTVGNPFTLSLASSAPLSTTSFSPTSTAFSPYTSSFVASSTSDTLTFKGSALPGDATVGLDEISVAVPEPATWAMMIIGFAMIGFGLRGRRKQSVRVTYA